MEISTDQASSTPELGLPPEGAPRPGSSGSAAPESFFVRTELPWGQIAWVFGMVLTCFLLYCGDIASGPDYNLSFRREVRSRLPAARLGEALTKVPDWPKWFSTVVEAKVIDGSDHPVPQSLQVATQGAVILLKADPRHGLAKPIELTVQVTRVVPGKIIELRVLDESSGRLFHSFESILWRIQVREGDVGLRPANGVTTLIGTETVRTASWRSRIFGRIARRIMMTQLFYPDLIKLADPAQTLSQDSGLGGPG